MEKIRIVRILEYYDVPQLFVAEDAIGMKYLCQLYDIAEDGELKVFGVAVSSSKLNDFIEGHIDLLDMFTFPETENSLFNILMNKKDIYAEPCSSIPDPSILPEKGYFYDACLNEVIGLTT